MISDAFIGVGSNLAQPLSQVGRALDRLAGLPRCSLVARSSLYRTSPIGQPGQDDYINAVAKLQTDLDPEELLNVLQAIENEQGRVRDGTRWGARTLDLDILLYGQQRINTDRLTVPHPELTNRAFVLIPLKEIVPDRFDPVGLGDVDTLLSNVDTSGVEQLMADEY